MRKSDSRINTTSVTKSVALWYPQGASAPFLMAKGKGEIAQRIIKVASDCGIPVVSNDDVVETISIAEVGQSIPEEAWQAVATIFAYVLKIK